MKTEEVLKIVPQLKKDELYFWRKSGFIHSQVIRDGRVKRHEWDLNEVQKIRNIKEYCATGLSPKEAYRRVKENLAVSIKFLGVGGAGCNILEFLSHHVPRGVQYIAIDTDVSSLRRSAACHRVHLGDKITTNLGLAGNWKLGAQAAKEGREELERLMGGADIVFISAGLGGGTGSGSAPVIAELARELGAVTIAIVTRPFMFEGSSKTNVAERALSRLKKTADPLVVIPNEQVLSRCDQDITIDRAFETVNDRVELIVESIAELVLTPGLIEVGYSDIKDIVRLGKPVCISVGLGAGKDRAINASRAMLDNYSLDTSIIKEATHVLFNISGPSDLSLQEVYDAAEMIKKAIPPTAEITFGLIHSRTLNDEVRVILFAAGGSPPDRSH